MNDIAQLNRALSFFTPEQRAEFYRWSESNNKFDGTTRHMLFGHPYYLLSMTDGIISTDIISDFIIPEHLTAIERYSQNHNTETRHFIDGLIFFRMHHSINGKQNLILAMTLESLDSYCKSRADSTPLTASELRVLAQVLTGQDLKQAARDDHVSYETKRSQLKTINSKLGFHRQIDLVAGLLSELLLELITSINQPADSNVLKTYLTRYAARQMRLQQLVGPSGRNFNVIDAGPIDGRPLIAIHPSFVSTGGDLLVEMLNEHNLRMIWPIRNGTLSADAPLLPLDQQLEHAFEGLDVARQIAGDQKATLHATGPECFLAIEYVKRNPNKVAQLIFQSISQTKDAKWFSSKKISSAISSLAVNSPLTFNLILRFINSKMNDPQAIHSYFANIFQNSPIDLAILKEQFEPPEFGERARFLIANSTHELVHQFHYFNHPGWDKIKYIKHIPLYFIHGERDGIVSPADVQALIDDLAHGKLTVIEGMGRLASPSAYQPIAKRIVDILARSQRI